MNRVFATTSWKARVGTNLPKVLKCILKQDCRLDSIQVYLSLDEFPNKLDDLPNELLEVKESDKRIEFIWTKGNLKSFKRLLSIKNNPNSSLCIYDDDTIFGPDWLSKGFGNLALNSWVNHSGWINLSCETRDLLYLRHYQFDPNVPDYYNTSNGYFINTNNYKDIDLDFELPVLLGINDDDYYFHMINTIHGIKSIKFNYFGRKKLLTSPSDMRNTIYTHKAVMEYWMDHDPEMLDRYFTNKLKSIKDRIRINKVELR